jgi:hypothetical protein
LIFSVHDAEQAFCPASDTVSSRGDAEADDNPASNGRHGFGPKSLLGGIPTGLRSALATATGLENRFSS